MRRHLKQLVVAWIGLTASLALILRVCAQTQAHAPRPDDIDGHYERVIGEATGGGGKGISASHVDAWLVNAKGNPTYKPTHLKVTNLGSKPCFFWSRIAQKSNWKVEAGQEALFELPPAQTSTADRAAGRDVLDSIDFTVEYWVPGPRRSSSAAPAQSPSPVPTESSSPSKSSEQILKENDEWVRQKSAAASAASPPIATSSRDTTTTNPISFETTGKTTRGRTWQSITVDATTITVNERTENVSTYPWRYTANLADLSVGTASGSPSWGYGVQLIGTVLMEHAGKSSTIRGFTAVFSNQANAEAFAKELQARIEATTGISSSSSPPSTSDTTSATTPESSEIIEGTRQGHFESRIAEAENELDTVYKKLRAKLSPAEKAALKREEVGWIKEKENLPEGSRGRYESIYNRIRKLEQRASTSTSATSETGPTSRAPSYASEETSQGHFETEIAAAENELTAVYNRLRAKLTPAEKVALKREEMGWIKEKENLPEGSRGRLECINKRIRDLEQRVP
jgi:uncharacterized protein YecT (DUF1311 family)